MEQFVAYETNRYAWVQKVLPALFAVVAGESLAFVILAAAGAMGLFDFEPWKLPLCALSAGTFLVSLLVSIAGLCGEVHAMREEVRLLKEWTLSESSKRSSSANECESLSVALRQDRREQGSGEAAASADQAKR